MWKSILEYVEKLLVVLLVTFATLGMFVVGNVVVKAILGRELANIEMIIIFLASMILTYIAINLVEELHIKLIDLDVEDEKKKEEIKALYKENINLDDIP